MDTEYCTAKFLFKGSTFVEFGCGRAAAMLDKEYEPSYTIPKRCPFCYKLTKILEESNERES